MQAIIAALALLILVGGTVLLLGDSMFYHMPMK